MTASSNWLFNTFAITTTQLSIPGVIIFVTTQYVAYYPHCLFFKLFCQKAQKLKCNNYVDKNSLNNMHKE